VKEGVGVEMILRQKILRARATISTAKFSSSAGPKTMTTAVRGALDRKLRNFSSGAFGHWPAVRTKRIEKSLRPVSMEWRHRNGAWRLRMRASRLRNISERRARTDASLPMNKTFNDSDSIFALRRKPKSLDLRKAYKTRGKLRAK
jgi:hypothetical protein